MAIALTVDYVSQITQQKVRFMNNSITDICPLLLFNSEHLVYTPSRVINTNMDVSKCTSFAMYTQIQ